MFSHRLVCWQAPLFAFLALLGTSESVWAQAFNPFSGGRSGSSGALTGGNGQAPAPAAASASDVSSQFQSLNRSAGAGSGNAGSGFVGQGNSSGRLVGAQQAGQSRNSRTTNQPRNFSQSNRNFSNRSANSNRFRGSTSNRGSFRPVQKIAFSFPKRASSKVGTSLKARFTELAQLSSRTAALKGISLGVDDAGKVTLSGDVDSERAKRLASALVRLEPGVRSVTNDLTVVAASQTP